MNLLDNHLYTYIYFLLLFMYSSMGYVFEAGFCDFNNRNLLILCALFKVVIIKGDSLIIVCVEAIFDSVICPIEIAFKI